MNGKLSCGLIIICISGMSACDSSNSSTAPITGDASSDRIVSLSVLQNPVNWTAKPGNSSIANSFGSATVPSTTYCLAWEFSASSYRVWDFYKLGLASPSGQLNEASFGYIYDCSYNYGEYGLYALDLQTGTREPLFKVTKLAPPTPTPTPSVTSTPTSTPTPTPSATPTPTPTPTIVVTLNRKVVDSNYSCTTYYRAKTCSNTKSFSSDKLTQLLSTYGNCSWSQPTSDSYTISCPDLVSHAGYCVDDPSHTMGSYYSASLIAPSTTDSANSCGQWTFQ